MSNEIKTLDDLTKYMTAVADAFTKKCTVAIEEFKKGIDDIDDDALALLIEKHGSVIVSLILSAPMAAANDALAKLMGE